jgi:hypothetical protein
MPTRKACRNSFARSGKGVSTIMSTIIITGTLLIILVIASFVSANVLDLQIANTEFEQAKTNILTLDETIQDVALRRGSGGYVQFNERSGGIGINITTQKLTLYGPAHETTDTKSPSALGSGGNWSNPTYAYASDNLYANASSDNLVQPYRNYGFNIPSGSTITKVEVGYEAYTTKGGSLNITCSWNNGFTWVPAQTSSSLETNDPNIVVWFDFTSVTSWTIDKLSDANFLTRARPVKLVGGSIACLDWLPVRVTYTPPLSPIYQSSNLVGILYRGGSKVSGTSLDLRGTDSLIVNMSDSLGYVRVATENGLKIKLDYYRIKLTSNSTLMIGGTFYNFTQITFINIINGTMGGTDIVNFKVQNIDVNTFTQEYNSSDVTIYVQLGTGQQTPIRLYSPTEGMSNPMKTAIIFTEVKIQVSTS